MEKQLRGKKDECWKKSKVSFFFLQTPFSVANPWVCLSATWGNFKVIHYTQHNELYGVFARFFFLFESHKNVTNTQDISFFNNSIMPCKKAAEEHRTNQLFWRSYSSCVVVILKILCGVWPFWIINVIIQISPDLYH